MAGRDAANYQGVGCPHTLANLQPGTQQSSGKVAQGDGPKCSGETVLDIGSGLGVDSFIASAAVGQVLTSSIPATIQILFRYYSDAM